MYCIKCGVKLADTESHCPLCLTRVYHPDLPRNAQEPLYPENKMPPATSGAKALAIVMIVLFLIPLAISFFSDLSSNGQLDWFGHVAGALIVAYVIFGLPLWFRKANPVIFAPCDFAAIGLYLWYLSWITGGSWFFPFALPVLGGTALILCSIITLDRYVPGGKIYISGGVFIAFGALLLLTETRLTSTFGLPFIGWSVYPLIVFASLGCFLIYLGIDSRTRETLRRKFFF